MLRQRNTKPEQEVGEHGGFSIGLSSHYYHIPSNSQVNAQEVLMIICL